MAMNECSDESMTKIIYHHQLHLLNAGFYFCGDDASISSATRFGFIGTVCAPTIKLSPPLYIFLRH
jgi:hypothetical protein